MSVYGDCDGLRGMDRVPGRPSNDDAGQAPSSDHRASRVAGRTTPVAIAADDLLPRRSLVRR